MTSTMGANSTIARVNEALYQISCHSPTALAILFSATPFLVFYIILNDLSTRKQSWKLATIFAPINSLLILICISFTGFGIFQSFYNKSRERAPMAGFTSQVFLSIWEVSFVYFSWIRSADLLRAMATPCMFSFYKTLLYLCPITSILPLVTLSAIGNPVIVGNRMALNIFFATNMINGSTVILLDNFFLTSFIAYKKRLHDDMGMCVNTSKKLEIIARYGLMASGFAMATLNLFGASSIAMMIDPDLVVDWVVCVYYVAWLLKDFCLAGTGFCLIAMKIDIVKLGPSDVNNGTGGANELAGTSGRSGMGK
ncbi:hypothetical protein BDR26DRAFT_1008456 [Obelidium mucronatum]|nr:hypothetical protein BDR26DRAFT_1008456 [Obelidium mucronatum]